MRDQDLFREMGGPQSPSFQNMAGALESGEGSLTAAISYFFGWGGSFMTWTSQCRICNSTPPKRFAGEFQVWSQGITEAPVVGEILKGEFVGRGQAISSFTWMILLGRKESEHKLPELYKSLLLKVKF